MIRLHVHVNTYGVHWYIDGSKPIPAPAGKSYNLVVPVNGFNLSSVVAV